MDLLTLIGLLGETPDSEKARPVFSHFPSLNTTVSSFSTHGVTLTETLLSSRDYGFEARLASSGKIITIYLMGAGNKGFGELPYPLADGLRFGASQYAVEAKFGSPHWSMSSTHIPVILHEAGKVIRYDRPGNTLYFQFDLHDGLLRQVAADLLIG